MWGGGVHWSIGTFGENTKIILKDVGVLETNEEDVLEIKTGRKSIIQSRTMSVCLSEA